MASSVEELSSYRLERAKEDLETARENLEANRFKASINRSYYSIFHALRAVIALDEFDSSKHSSVIAFFNRRYVKEGIFDKQTSKIIDTAYRLREKADYNDFFIASMEQAQEQYDRAELFLQMIRPYLEEHWV